jgi:excisionase family DNA binding protein
MTFNRREKGYNRAFADVSCSFIDNLILEKKGRLVTAHEVAELLAVSVRTIRDWTYLRKIPFIKINGAVRFDLKVLKKWVTEELWQS